MLKRNTPSGFNDHTLTQILMGLLNSGFKLEVVEEAQPPEEMMHIPGMTAPYSAENLQ